MKKSLSLLLIVVMAMTLLVGCNKDANEGSKEGVASDDVIEISFGHGFMPDTPHHKAALKFKEEVEGKTDGRVVVEVFPSGQLGSAREMFEGLQMGTQEIALVPTARISGFVPELQIFDLPFLFPEREIAYEIMDGEIGQELLDLFEEQSIKGVAFYEDGFKHFTANKELRTADDFKGLKFRTMESPIIMSQFKSLGANPVPIDFSELYNSLQLGVVEGQENPLVTIHSMKFYEVQDYLILSEHAYLGHVLLFADNWFNGLPEDIQQILISTSRDVAKWQREEVQKEEQKYLKEIEESGTNIIRLTDEEKEALRETTLPVHEEYKNMFGDEILNKIYDEIGR